MGMNRYAGVHIVCDICGYSEVIESDYETMSLKDAKNICRINDWHIGKRYSCNDCYQKVKHKKVTIREMSTEDGKSVM